MLKRKCSILLIFFTVVFQLNHVIGQIVVEEELKMLYWEHTHGRVKLKDAKDFRDVFHKDKYLLGKKRIGGNISYNTGRVLIENSDHTRHNEIRSAIGFFTRIRFFEEFSINTTFYKDYNQNAAPRWISDYYYSIGRYNWRANKFNYGYENYVNNKYKDNFKTFSKKFLEGYYFLSYNQSLSKKLIRKIKLDTTTYVSFVYFARYYINYRDENEVTHGTFFGGKPVVGGGVRFTLFWNIYVESALYFYYMPTIQQQPWDPDYTYGFGYFDWRSFRISATYGNWSVNRFSWKNSFYPYYGFLDGNFRIAVNWIW